MNCGFMVVSAPHCPFVFVLPLVFSSSEFDKGC